MFIFQTVKSFRNSDSVILMNMKDINNKCPRKQMAVGMIVFCCDLRVTIYLWETVPLVEPHNHIVIIFNQLS